MITKKEIFILFILTCISLLRFLFFIPEKPSYEKVAGEKVEFVGVVSDAPDVRLENKRLTVTPEGQESNILVTVPRVVDVEYGDKIKVMGVLEIPESFTTNSGKEFDYKGYLAGKDIYYIVKNAEIEVISHSNGSWLKEKLFRIRDAFIESISKVISPPESDLANGLVLGTRGGFDSKMRDEFISTGTIHIVALSGYNVTIVAEGVMKILGYVLSSTLSIVFGIIFIFLFIMLAGASATAIRAGIMATIALFARLTGRAYDAGRALVIAGILMVAYDPRTLFDISFQLSFLATFGVLFITPKTIKWVLLIPMKFGLRELVATTLGATIAVLPILLYSTGILSLISLPANILILPFIPLAMLFIFLTGMLGFISSIIAIPFGFISHLLLSYILGIIHFFASLPFASVTIKSFPLILTIALYIAILYWVFRKRP